MSATIIAEALAAAERETPCVEYNFGSPRLVRRLRRYPTVLGNGSLSIWGGADTFGAVKARADSQFTEDYRGFPLTVGDMAVCVRADVVEAALKHIAAKLERAEERIADLRAVASRMVCDSVQSYGVSDAFCGCVTCQVKGYVGKEGEP